MCGEGLRGGELPEGQPQEASSAHKQRPQQRVLEAERRGSFPHCTLGEYRKHSSEIWNIPQALGRSQGSTHFQPRAKNEKVPGSCCTNSRTHTNLLILTWVCAPYLPGTGHVTNTHAPTFTHTCMHIHMHTHTPHLRFFFLNKLPQIKWGHHLALRCRVSKKHLQSPQNAPGLGLWLAGTVESVCLKGELMATSQGTGESHITLNSLNQVCSPL